MKKRKRGILIANLANPIMIKKLIIKSVKCVGNSLKQ